jgi:predicted oxidoreductase
MTTQADADTGTHHAVHGRTKLSELIRERGLDDQTASDQIGLSKYYVQSICAGRMHPGRNAQVKIAKWSRPDGGVVPSIGLDDWLTDEDRSLLASKAS